MKRAVVLVVVAMVLAGVWSMPAQAAKILFVGDKAGSGTLPKHDHDDAIVAHLENDLGHTVTRVSGSGSSASDADGKHLVMISESIASSSVLAKFKDVAVGCLVMEVWVYDDMKMASGMAFVVDKTTVTIVDDTHPLAGGFSGEVTVYDPMYSMGVGIPFGDGVAVAQGSDTVLFGYDTGDLMDGMNAPARRTGFFLPAELNPFENNLTADGLALFDAAVAWTLPEPMTLVLMLVGGLPLMRRRRR